MVESLRYGCALIAFAPTFTILIFLLSRRPQLVILFLASAFAWLISALITSIFWNFIYAVSSSNLWAIVVIFSVIFQELCRFGLVYAFRRTEKIIKGSSSRASEIFPLNDVTSSLASGIGFGMMHSLMMYGSLLASSNGSGDLFVDSCPAFPLILVSAFLALAFSVLDIILTCLAFIAERNRSMIIASIIVGLHFFAALATLGNQINNGCSFSIPILYLIVILAGSILAWMWPLMMRASVNSNSTRNYF